MRADGWTLKSFHDGDTVSVGATLFLHTRWAATVSLLSADRLRWSAFHRASSQGDACLGVSSQQQQQKERNGIIMPFPIYIMHRHGKPFHTETRREHKRKVSITECWKERVVPPTLHITRFGCSEVCICLCTLTIIHQGKIYPPPNTSTRPHSFYILYISMT